MNRNPIRIMLMVLAVLGMLVAPMAFAQEDTDEGEATDRPKFERPDRADRERVDKEALAEELEGIEEVEISREVDELPNDVEPADPDVANTALVFTNMSRVTTWVKCVGYNMNGEPIGRTATVLPPLGLRYVRASDISNGVDFIGQVQCAARGRVVGSVVFVGPGLTDLPVHNGAPGHRRIRFPLVAHY
ncbi:MAG: hypothetical protein GY733_25060 [bacterium]|nr:hypothetical protein [bacterium]